MANVRSPSYPSIPLNDAIIRAGDLFDKERFNPISREAAAKLFGYSGLTGGSNTLLADLAAYGLIERVGKGEVRVSQLLVRIIHPDNAEEYGEALSQAALNPKLFMTLRERFPDHLPSEDNLEGILVRMGFSSKGTKPAKKSFLETFQYLEEQGVSESHGLAAADQPESAVEKPKMDAGALRASAPAREVAANMKEDVYSLPEGDVILHWPERLSQDSYEEVKDWTELMLRKLKRQVERQKQEGAGSED